MDSAVFILLGILLFLLFILWLLLVNKKLSKTLTLVCDTLLIVFSVVVLVMGLQIRNRALDKDREVREQEMLQELELKMEFEAEKETIFDADEKIDKDF